MIIRSMIGHVRGMLSTYGSDAITPIVLQPDMVYANLWALRHSYSFRSITAFVAFLLKESTRLLYQLLYSSWSGARCVWRCSTVAVSQ